MPIHDWQRVSAGTFHHFHSGWITHLGEALNDGRLPVGYYAMAEQHAGQTLPDVLTLPTLDDSQVADAEGVAAVQVKPPRIARHVVANEATQYRLLRRTLTIRHSSNHRVVALLEIVSPTNKDRSASVTDFVEKACSALKQGIHVLMSDLFPAGPRDPERMHGEISYVAGLEDEHHQPLPSDQPLTLASYISRRLPEGYVEPLAVGDTLPAMPLFLDPDFYIEAPLETTYQQAYRGVPSVWRELLESPR
jgi:uncharacterized protein DUF4058